MPGGKEGETLTMCLATSQPFFAFFLFFWCVAKNQRTEIPLARASLPIFFYCTYLLHTSALSPAHFFFLSKNDKTVLAGENVKDFLKKPWRENGLSLIHLFTFVAAVFLFFLLELINGKVQKKGARINRSSRQNGWRGQVIRDHTVLERSVLEGRF